MIRIQKCNCCMHNEICSKKALYEGTCRDVNSVITQSRDELVSVSLNCKHFKSVIPNIKDGNENLNNKGGANNDR